MSPINFKIFKDGRATYGRKGMKGMFNIAEKITTDDSLILTFRRIPMRPMNTLYEDGFIMRNMGFKFTINGTCVATK